MTVVACHQPNFLPWLGFFAKMSKADIFVLLDDVQFTQGSGRNNWTTRVRIMGSNGPLWLSVPVLRSNLGPQLIYDIRADDPAKWLARMFRTLRESYGKSPFGAPVIEAVIDVIARNAGNICATNVAFIEYVHSLLDLKSRIVLASSIPVGTSSTDRLIELTRACGGDVYLSGDGASGYQISHKFSDNGLQLLATNFVTQSYPQRRRGAEFVPGLSIVDALCNVGASATRALLEAVGENI